MKIEGKKLVFLVVVNAYEKFIAFSSCSKAIFLSSCFFTLLEALLDISRY